MPQTPPVSSATTGSGEPASPAENFPIPANARNGGKPTKTQEKRIAELIDEAAAAHGKTSDELRRAAFKSYPNLTREQADELIGKLERYATAVPA